MESIRNFIFRIHKGIVGLALILAFSNNIFGALYGQIQRGGGILCSSQACVWERSDQRCNDNSECCPGKGCNSFGYCTWGGSL